MKIRSGTFPHLIPLVWVLLFPGMAFPQSVSVSTAVAWNPAATHSGTAGLDLDNIYTCAMGDYRLSVRGGTYDRTWHVDVQMTQSAGDPAFILEVLRDPSETRITGGDSWVTVGTTATYFFSSNNTRNLNNLDIQYRLSNVSSGTANMATGTFTVTITYTIVNTLTHPP